MPTDTSTELAPGPFRVAALKAAVERLAAAEFIDACWEGGSASTGRLDHLSDIDLYVVADGARTDAAFEVFEGALASVARITHTWSVEPPAFAGLAQRHYLLDPAPRYFAIECCVLQPDHAQKFLERERHGEPIVHFDRTGRIRSLPLDRPALAARLARRFAQIRAAWPIYRLLVEKEILRGHALDVYGFYVNGLLRALIELAGMRHRPERFVFGWRYLHYDLPADLQQALTQFAQAASTEDIARRLPEIDRWMAQLVEQIEVRPAILSRAAVD
ncbi:MAG: hypothetical protein ACM3PU_03690 [Gemmatimonadota bacterium]